MKKWSSFERVASSDQRIQLIVFDINYHFLNNYKAKELHFKAMLATDKKKDAVRYLRAFEALGDSNVGVVISAPDVREGYKQLDEVSEDIVFNFLEEMKNKYGNAIDYEETLKSEFNYGELDLLIT